MVVMALLCSQHPVASFNFSLGHWFLSLTVAPEAIKRVRTGHHAAALDWGVETLLTGVRGEVVSSLRLKMRVGTNRAKRK